MKKFLMFLLVALVMFGSMHSWSIVSANDGADDQEDTQDANDDNGTDANDDESDDDQDDASDDDSDDDEDANDESDDDEDDTNDDDSDDADKEAPTSCTPDARDLVFIDKFKEKMTKVFPQWKDARRMKVKETMEHLLTKLPKYGRVYCIVDALHANLVTLSSTVPVATDEMSLMEKMKAKIAALIEGKGGEMHKGKDGEMNKGKNK